MQQQGGRNAKPGYGKIAALRITSSTCLQSCDTAESKHKIQHKQQAANGILGTDQLPLFQ